MYLQLSRTSPETAKWDISSSLCRSGQSAPEKPEEEKISLVNKIYRKAKEQTRKSKIKNQKKLNKRKQRMKVNEWMYKKLQLNVKIPLPVVMALVIGFIFHLII